MTTLITPAEVRDILAEPEQHEWEVQLFGMLRTYLSPEVRLHVWDQNLATWGSSRSVHDHPWDFSCTIMGGVLFNQRFRSLADGSTACPNWAGDLLPIRKYTETRIKPGIGGGRLEGPRERWVQEMPVEVYAASEQYEQEARELHLTRYLQGTVTLIERTNRREQDEARSLWVGDAPSDFVAPRPASNNEVRRTTQLALSTWFNNY